MKNYIVKITNGLCEAPYMIIEAEKPETAEQIARKQSGLGRFENWKFFTYRAI